MRQITKVKLGGNFADVPDAKPAPAGLYTGQIAEAETGDSNNGEPMLTVRWTLVADENGKKLGKDQQYDPVYTYHPLDPESSWARRMKELLRALGLKQTGTVDIKANSKALLRLKDGTDQDGNYRPNVSKLLKIGENGASAEAEDDEAEDEDEDSEEEVDLDEMDRDELKAFIKENELGVRVLKKDDDDKLREKIREAMPDEEEDDEEGEDDEEEDEDTVDLDDLDRNEMKALIKEQGLEIKVLKKDSDDDLRAKIAEALGGEEEDDEEEGTGDNYDELDLKTLVKEAKDRDVDSTAKGNAAQKKKILIARLRADDAEEPV